MRNINQNIKWTIDRIREMKGVPLYVKVNRGRNKFETIEGVIESAYPAVFTVRASGGEINTFSYADILARNIFFYQKPPERS